MFNFFVQANFYNNDLLFGDLEFTLCVNGYTVVLSAPCADEDKGVEKTFDSKTIRLEIFNPDNILCVLTDKPIEDKKIARNVDVPQLIAVLNALQIVGDDMWPKIKEVLAPNF